MRLIAALLSVLLIHAPDALAREEATFGFYDYVWGISGSDMDPHAHAEPPFTGERDLYLWLDCAYDGFTSMKMQIETTFELVSFTPVSGFTNTGTLPNIELSAEECQFLDYVVVGVLRVRDAAGLGGDLCFTGTNVTFDCDLPKPFQHPSGYFGYVTESSQYCHRGDCVIDYAVPRSWGAVKSGYAEP